MQFMIVTVNTVGCYCK